MIPARWKSATLSTTLALCTSSGCVPEFEDTPHLVESTRILAIRGIPAEARPNTEVRYEVLVASPSGTRTVPLDYSYCTESRRAEERTGVSATCLVGDSLVQITQSATLLSEGCARFGPNAPPAMEGQAARRATDPDPSGGYYLPLQVSVPGEPETATFGFHRIRCDLAGATRKIFEAFEEGYEQNRHPQVAGLWASDKDATMSGNKKELSGQELITSPGASLSLLLELRADSFENYVVYSAEEAALFDRKEGVRVNWYFSAGSLEKFSQDMSQSAREANNTWTAPVEPGLVHGWLVVVDDRGGATWASFRFLVQ